MKHTRIALLAAAALWGLPATGFAQGEGEEAPVVDADAPAEGEGAAAGEVPAEGGEEFDDSEFEETGEGVGDICQIDPAACPTLDMAKEAAKPLDETIKAVQQRFIIKKHRFELQPFWGVTLNDQFVGHPGPGIGANFYITEVMAVGINGQYYDPFNNESSFNAQVRRAARVGVPLTEYQWAAAANFTYVPASGKFAGFGNFIFHYDMYVVGGVGAISTRPIAVIDPDYRNFAYQPNVAFNVGIGLKIFFNRWFAAVLEVRDYIFIDQLENLEVGATPMERADDTTWLGDTSLTNNVQAQLGVSVFIPFSFKYRLPKAGADTAGGAK
jgi:outer membrane beta-barrel protein